MFSRPIVQLLLSLLLLVSQQLALSHGYTHVPNPGPQQVQLDTNDDGSPKAPAADHLCGQCLSASQLAFALGLPTWGIKAVRPEYVLLDSIFTAPACLQPVCHFQPRAPPRA
ncbi:hypothetical protein IP91_04653 [Pseudoduganella lurida]|uniref:DUF2946 domain-containing protein n=1 Tax=Pseudoduganella lurida TaxID=1036180 RepID=A0A562QXQ2_9BURK|nr:hypothetical protein [Pseudoduganella lurida]TWI61572.1 hypothetical protein IP91_04653 [Pseudoduganella lurida]